MKNTLNYEILNTRIFDANDLDSPNKILAPLGGCNDKGGELGIGCYQVEFEISATNKQNNTKKFTIVFESLERNNSLKAYSGYEMTLSDSNPSDSSKELVKFCGNEFGEKIIDDLIKKAELYAKEFLDSH